MKTGTAEFPLKLGELLTLVFLPKIDYEGKEDQNWQTLLSEKFQGPSRHKSSLLGVHQILLNAHIKRGQASRNNKCMVPRAQKVTEAGTEGQGKN